MSSSDDNSSLIRLGGTIWMTICLSLVLLVLPLSVALAGDHYYFNADYHLLDNIAALGGERIENLPIPVLFGVSIGDFGDTWGDPRSGGRLHKGTDISAPRGELVASPTDAIVISAGWNDLGGYYVTTANPGGEQFYFAHLDGVAEGLEEGDVLKTGDLIGYVGSTGNATIPHLHFEIITLAQSLNPFPRITREFSEEERVVSLEGALDTKRISFKANNSSVRFLQSFLINERTGKKAGELAVEGATGYFGNLTKLALIEYQAANGIEPAEGYFGPITQGTILASIDPNNPKVHLASEDSSLASSISTVSEITSDLELGDSGDQVELLQTFLITKKTGPEALVLAIEGATGYFGQMTEAALIEYQKDNAIYPAKGYFGEITRKAIKSS